LPDVKMYRVENRVSEGMPDVHYIRNGKSGWIELKYLDDWPKSKICVGLRLNQSFWLNEYDELKGRCWILIRIGKDFVGMIKGSDARKVYEKITVPEFLDCLVFKKFGRMDQGDWAKLADIITEA